MNAFHHPALQAVWIVEDNGAYYSVHGVPGGWENRRALDANNLWLKTLKPHPVENLRRLGILPPLKANEAL